MKEEKKYKLVLIIILFIFILFSLLIFGFKKNEEEKAPKIISPYGFSKQEEMKKCNLLKEFEKEKCQNRIIFINAYYIEKNLKECLNISDLELRNDCIIQLASLYKNSKNCERIADKKISESCTKNVGIRLRRIDFCDLYKGEPHEEQECIDRIYAFIYGDVGKINKCSSIQTLEYSGLCEMNSILDSGKSCDDIEDEQDRNECRSAEDIYSNKIRKKEDCEILKDDLYKRVCIDRFEKWAGIDDITCHDSDGDGLWNSNELWLKTDPYNPDTDGDGLTDYEEVIIYRTNPMNPDTDGDGWNDKKEVEEKTSCQRPDTDGDGTIDSLDKNPMDNDQDRDGLIDEIEIKFGTDINNPDTDSDGISDKDEFYRGLNPFGEGLIDSDKDGLFDIDEIFYKTDRFNPDTDGDGISDKDEIDNLANPFGEGDMDFDGDGISDKDEEKYGTNPTKEDTDDDNMSDYDEIFVYKTDPNIFNEQWK